MSKLFCMNNVKYVFMALSLFLIQACSETSTTKAPENNTPPDNGVVDLSVTLVDDLCDPNAAISNFLPVTAIAATTAADFGSGAHAIITGDVNGQFTSLNGLKPTFSDITVVTYGKHFYIIEQQLAGNNITKYAVDNPQTVIWQYSVNESSNPAVLSNPHDMIFVSETKAYVIRYNKTKVWIVNPSATTEADFKIGELDLSAYGGDDSTPEMDTGFIADGQFYIVLQRLEGATQRVVNDAYIAIFDVNTDQEIDANISGDTLKGIRLLLRNPRGVNYLAATNTLYVLSSGSFFPMSYIGGIEAIDLSTYKSTIILDDGDEQSHPFGLITSLAVISDERLYFVGYENADMNTLYLMDVKNRTVSPVNVSQLIDGQIQSIVIDPQGLLWVSDNANATVRILNPLSCNEIDAVSTNLNPARIVFAQ